MCVGNVKPQKNFETLEDSIKIISNTNDINCDKKQILNYSILFVLIYYTKLVLCLFNSVNKKLQNLYFFKLLLKTTQFAHLITLISALILAKILTPYENNNDLLPPPNFMKLIYLGSFSTHLGFQIWMTFISGLALYFCLPRHTFGDVQKVLFPKYFMINAILSLITLITFLQYQENGKKQNIQIIALVTCFCIELLTRLYLAPVLLKLITDKNIMETAAGVGMEVGQHKAGPLKNCPVYMQLHKTFRKVHMTIAIGNMITMACTAIHLYYLSDKIII